MELSELLRPEDTLVGLRARNKPQLLGELSRRAATSVRLEPSSLESALAARERLGSTGMGRGFALPHARIAALSTFFGLFARLSRPIAFEAIDGQPVDLVFLLLIPDRPGDGHVAALAAISRRMRDPAVVARLRKAANAAEAYRMLTDGPAGT